MLKTLICICTYKRNSSLLECIKSIKKLNRFNKNEIGILILDNTINNNSLKISKELKKTKLNIYHLNEKKRGIVNERNKCYICGQAIDPTKEGLGPMGSECEHVLSASTIAMYGMST